MEIIIIYTVTTVRRVFVLSARVKLLDPLVDIFLALTLVGSIVDTCMPLLSLWSYHFSNLGFVTYSGV